MLTLFPDIILLLVTEYLNVATYNNLMRTCKGIKRTFHKGQNLIRVVCIGGPSCAAFAEKVHDYKNLYRADISHANKHLLDKIVACCPKMKSFRIRTVTTSKLTLPMSLKDLAVDSSPGPICIQMPVPKIESVILLCGITEVPSTVRVLKATQVTRPWTIPKMLTDLSIGPRHNDLPSLPLLTRLSLECLPNSAWLACLNSLKCLCISNTRISETNMLCLGLQTSLETLELENCNLVYINNFRWTILNSLERIILRGCVASPYTFYDIPKNLNFVSMSDMLVPTKFFRILSVSQIKHIGLVRCPNVSSILKKLPTGKRMFQKLESAEILVDRDRAVWRIIRMSSRITIVDSSLELVDLAYIRALFPREICLVNTNSHPEIIKYLKNAAIPFQEYETSQR